MRTRVLIVARSARTFRSHPRNPSIAPAMRSQHEHNYPNEIALLLKDEPAIPGIYATARNARNCVTYINSGN